MAIRRSVGCNCCGPVDPQVITGCCDTKVLKPYVDWTGSEASPDFSGAAHTDWVIEEDATTEDPHYVSGDVPTENQNILPANSTIEFTADICCYDYLFDIQLFDIDANDDETIIRCGASRWQASGSGENLIRSSMQYDETSVSRSFSSVQFTSFVGDGGVLHEVCETPHSHWHSNSALAPYNLVDVNTAGYSRYLRSINNPSSFIGNEFRTIRLTIQTGQYPIKVGGVTFKQGLITKLGSTAPCMKVRGVATTGVRRGTDTYPRTGVEQAYRLSSGGGVTLAGFANVGYTFDIKGVPHNQCNNQTQPHVTGSFDISYAALNGTYDRVLVDNTTNLVVSGSVFTSISQMVQSCATGVFEHDDDLIEWWKYTWHEQNVNPKDVLDNSNYCTVSSPIPDTCSSAIDIGDPSLGFNKEEPATIANFSFSNTEGSPCYALDYPFGTMFYGTEFCYGSGVTSDSFDGKPVSTPISVLPVPSPNQIAWSSCNDSSQVNFQNNVPVGNVGSFTYSPLYHTQSPSGTVNGASYSWDQHNLVMPATSTLKTSEAEQSSLKPVVTVYQPSGSAEFTGTSGVDDTRTYISFNLEYHNKVTVTGGFTGSISGYEKHCFLGNYFTDLDDARSLRFTHADDHSGFSKLFKNCISELTIVEKTYDSNGDLDTEVTSTQNASVDAIIPDLTADLVEFIQDPFNPWNYIEQPKHRPAGVYNDGKYYYYNEDTGFDRIEEAWQGPAYSLPKFMEVTMDSQDVWHIVFDKDRPEVRNVTQNYRINDWTMTYTDNTDCDPTEYSWTQGSSGPNGSETIMTFKMKGQE